MVALGTPLLGLIKYLESIRGPRARARCSPRSLFNRARITSPCALRVYEEKNAVLCGEKERHNRLRKINRRKYRDYSPFRRVLPLQSRHDQVQQPDADAKLPVCRGNFDLSCPKTHRIR